MMAVAGVVLAVVMVPLTYISILRFHQPGLIEGINVGLNSAMIAIGLTVIWVLKCNKL